MDFHQAAIQCAFERADASMSSFKDLVPVEWSTNRSSTTIYIKSYQIEDVCFDIAIRASSDPYTILPDAYVIQRPQQYKGCLLPHIRSSGFFCYAAQGEGDWDPYDLNDIIKAVDVRIEETLKESKATYDSNPEFQIVSDGEITGYWESTDRVFLLCNPVTMDAPYYAKLTSRKTATNSTPKKEDVVETVIYDKGTAGDFERWMDHRDLQEIKAKTEYSISHIKVGVKKHATVDWPPASLSDFLEWLKEVDPAAKFRALSALSSPDSTKKILLIDMQGQDLIAIKVSLELNKAQLEQYKPKNFGSLSSSHKNIKKGKKKVYNANTNKRNRFELYVTAPHMSSVTRIDVTAADKDTIISRNRPRPSVGDLRSIRIALIGCGTIGGYIAELLVRSGAGCGDDKTRTFDLFDNDTFSPQNFGRHRLTTKDIGQNKAVAMAKALKASSHLASNIVGIPKAFLCDKATLNKYDLVIDATGRPPVSKRLALTVRNIEKGKRPIIVHGFNDVNGRIAKVVIDEGTSCYGCHRSNRDYYRDGRVGGMDIRLDGRLAEYEAELRTSCGNTYSPYDAGISMITAALMQEAALMSLESEFTWTYAEHSRDKEARTKRLTMQSQLPGCRVCNERV
jgi:molybdopterin/thiamine biosynthesis adenylyltransferase